ncbi:transglutaminase domain-containing protein [Streptococcus hillyeri]|uniref:transglutaminase domain-containing protein n=1 Tax=Streptococcus hillyeri TaxID=2282420 RepID=UPI0034E1F546
MKINQEITLKRLALKLTVGVIGVVLTVGTPDVSAENHARAVSQSRVTYQAPSILSRVMDKRDAKHKFKMSELSLKESLEKAFSESGNKSISVHTFAGERSKAEVGTTADILTQLKKELGDNVESDYTLLLVNDTFLNHNTIAYVVKKSGRIVNTMSEYQALVREMLTTNQMEQEVYASIGFKRSFSDILLHANGLALVPQERRYNIINDVEMHGANYRLSISAEELSQIPQDKTLLKMESYIQNDTKIWELIQKSGVLDKKTDEEKVKAWSDFVQRNFPYDTAALAARKNNYNVASSIFSVTERAKAMCVGYSTLSARAFNMMGIRSYVVYGFTPSGGGHAVTRSYYDGAWHFVGTTAAENASIVSYVIDTYVGTDGSATNNQMVVNKAFEKWAEKQRPRDLLLVNTEIGKSSNQRDDEFISVNEYKELQERQQFIRERYQYIVEKVKKDYPDNPYLLENVESFLKAVEKDQEETTTSDLLIGSLADNYTEHLTDLEKQAGAIEYQLKFEPFKEGKSFKDITYVKASQDEVLKEESNTVQQLNETLNNIELDEKSEHLRTKYSELYRQYETTENTTEKETIAKQLLDLGRQIETEQVKTMSQDSTSRDYQAVETGESNQDVREEVPVQEQGEAFSQEEATLETASLQNTADALTDINQEATTNFMNDYVAPVFDYAVPVVETDKHLRRRFGAQSVQFGNKQ